MKKALSVIIMLVMAILISTNALAADTISFTPTVTNLINNADDSSFRNSGWNRTEYNRALLVNILMLDASNKGLIESTDIDLTKGAILGYDGLTYWALVIKKNSVKMHLIHYTPLLESAGYSQIDVGEIIDSISDMKSLSAELDLSSDIEGDFSYISVSSILESLSDLRDAVNSLN